MSNYKKDAKGKLFMPGEPETTIKVLNFVESDPKNNIKHVLVQCNDTKSKRFGTEFWISSEFINLED